MSLLPRWFNKLPTKIGRTVGSNIGNFLEDFDESLNALTSNPTGLSVYADDQNIYIEAAVPGLKANEVNVSIDDDNVLWIKGEKKEEEKDKDRRYYKKAIRSFSYCVPLSEEIDESISVPKATCKDGVMKIVFKKKQTSQKKSRKIDVEGS